MTCFISHAKFIFCFADGTFWKYTAYTMLNDLKNARSYPVSFLEFHQKHVDTPHQIVEVWNLEIGASYKTDQVAPVQPHNKVLQRQTKSKENDWPWFLCKTQSHRHYEPYTKIQDFPAVTLLFRNNGRYARKILIGSQAICGIPYEENLDHTKEKLWTTFNRFWYDERKQREDREKAGILRYPLQNHHYCFFSCSWRLLAENF